ncbi:hypothetical protein Ancab_036796 [Ancistrocladus abbreviatus]
MGEHEGRAQPSGLLPNGLLPNASGSVIRALDGGRWSKAEERTAKLIARIQPNQPSDRRRNAVADYVQRLIMKCFPCQVFTFGSVPLKTYLPDGDIDLTAFSKNQNLKETWASQVRDILESEEKNENAEFRVKEVQYIQAEVKIIKCLVENIVVDISFDQLGGLCTLCFLDEVDALINQNHLFKRSIILIKAWCYYESRILGAHHGLISTYALETLVLYIFHVFNNCFAGPLEVLYRFLEFFSNFDWENFCVSLWGPVPISSLPDVTAEPPRKDSGNLLLSKVFLDACSTVYAVFPDGQENQGQPFVSKHFNVIDPLRVNNNLGRSVSKGNFFRIRSAFAFGAKRLARLLDCPKEDIVFELNQFFMNTWERHGSGNRPDAPTSDLWHLRPSNTDHFQGLDNYRNTSSSMKVSENSSVQEIEVEGPHSSCSLSSEHRSYPLESSSKNSDSAPHTQSQKSYGNLNGPRISDQTEKSNSNQQVPVDRGQRSSKPDQLMNEIQGKYLFARTRSSPELSHTYSFALSRGGHSKPTENGKSQATSSRADNSQRKNMGSETAPQSTTTSLDDPSSIRHISSPQTVDNTADSNSGSNVYVDDSGVSVMGEEHVSVMGAQGMHQEEQDLVNMMASSVHNFGAQVPMPLNLASTHMPLQISPSILASIGYAQRNLTGIVPPNIPLIEPPWASNIQFPQGLISSSLSQYFPGSELTPNSADLVMQGNENFGSGEMAPGEVDNDFWHERNGPSNRGFGPDNASSEMLNTDDGQPSTSGNSNFVPLSRFGGSSSSMRVQHKVASDNRGFMREESPETFQNLDDRENEIYADDRVASSWSSSPTHAGSIRSRGSSESSWDASSAKASKMTREKRGTTTASPAPSSVYGKGKSISEHAMTEADDDNRDWHALSTISTEMSERSTANQSAAALHVPRHHISGFEATQTSESDSLIPITPMILGPGSRQRVTNNSGAAPFAFYPTGPPVPFLTMIPVYNFPSDTSTSDVATSHMVGEHGLDNNEPSQNFESPRVHVEPEVWSATSPNRGAPTAEPSDEHKSDILNSDFASHWQNLLYGRFCQTPRHHGPVIYPSSVVVPPVYLPGQFPWDGPGRPLAANMNLFSQLMGYGPHFVPIAPLQSVSNRPASVYQHYADELPRYRSGTGTYLPNPASVRDRNSSGTRRGNYNYDRNDHAGDKEGSWNANSKSRAAGRNRCRNQAADKSSSRLDRLAANENQADRPWGSYRHESVPSYQSQHGLEPNSAHTASGSVAYRMYPLPGMNPSGADGPPVPSVVMFYPYDHNSGFGASGQQLEFGSLGPVDFVGTVTNEVSQEVNQMRGTLEEPRFRGSSAPHASADQPSSPHLRRA